MNARATLQLLEAPSRDAESLATLGRRAYSAHYAGIWSPAGLAGYLDAQYSPEVIREQLISGSARWFIIALEDSPVGYVKIRLDRPLPVNPSERGMELEKIYMLPDSTGRGFGGEALRRVLELGEKWGQALTWLDVLQDNAGGRRFYERQGFRVVGAHPFATDLREIGMWVMMRRV